MAKRRQAQDQQGITPKRLLADFFEDLHGLQPDQRDSAAEARYQAVLDLIGSEEKAQGVESAGLDATVFATALRDAQDTEAQLCVPVYSSVLGLAPSQPQTMELQPFGSTTEASLQFREAALCKAKVQVSTVAVPGYVCCRSRPSHRLVTLSLTSVGPVTQGHQTLSVLLSALCR